MRKLLASVAIGALALSPLSADPGGGHGGGGHGGGQGNGGPHANGGGQGGGRGNGHAPGAQARGGGNPHGQGNGQGHSIQQAAPRMQQVERHVRVAPAQRQLQVHRAEGPAFRGHGNGNGNGRAHQQVERRAMMPERGGPGRVERENFRQGNPAGERILGSVRPERFGARQANGFVIDGCPPGLAKKLNGCMPPGLQRTSTVVVQSWQQPAWYGADWYGDRYRYYDGYMLRMGSDDRILGYVPLLGGALAVGEAWPGDYQSVAVPDYYRTFYDLGPTDSYRYYDDAIYGVDPGQDTITSLIALLTGDEFSIGDMMPDGYDIYNVPDEYRGQYADGPDAMYRYSDGYVYEIDPTTRLVQAAIQLLTA